MPFEEPEPSSSRSSFLSLGSGSWSPPPFSSESPPSSSEQSSGTSEEQMFLSYGSRQHWEPRNSMALVRSQNTELQFKLGEFSLVQVLNPFLDGNGEQVFLVQPYKCSRPGSQLTQLSFCWEPCYDGVSGSWKTTQVLPSEVEKRFDLLQGLYLPVSVQKFWASQLTQRPELETSEQEESETQVLSSDSSDEEDFSGEEDSEMLSEEESWSQPAWIVLSQDEPGSSFYH